MTDTEQRFGLTMRGVDRDEPGLIRERDGTVWLVKPDGTRVQLPGGGGGGGGSPFTPPFLVQDDSSGDTDRINVGADSIFIQGNPSGDDFSGIILDGSFAATGPDGTPQIAITDVGVYIGDVEGLRVERGGGVFINGSPLDVALHGIMGNAVWSLDGGLTPINYPVGNGNPTWVAIYDTDGYADNPTPDFFRVTIPPGLGGLYVIEAIIYLGEDPDLTSATFIFEDPSDSGDFDVRPSLVQDFVGSISFTRPLVEGNQVRMDLAAIGGAATSVEIRGGALDTGTGIFATNIELSCFTITRVGPLPSGWTGYPATIP